MPPDAVALFQIGRIAVVDRQAAFLHAAHRGAEAALDIVPHGAPLHIRAVVPPLLIIGPLEEKPVARSLIKRRGHRAHLLPGVAQELLGVPIECVGRRIQQQIGIVRRAKGDARRPGEADQIGIENHSAVAGKEAAPVAVGGLDAIEKTRRIAAVGTLAQFHERLRQALKGRRALRSFAAESVVAPRGHSIAQIGGDNARVRKRRLQRDDQPRIEAVRRRNGFHIRRIGPSGMAAKKIGNPLEVHVMRRVSQKDDSVFVGFAPVDRRFHMARRVDQRQDAGRGAGAGSQAGNDRRRIVIGVDDQRIAIPRFFRPFHFGRIGNRRWIAAKLAPDVARHDIAPGRLAFDANPPASLGRGQQRLARFGLGEKQRSVHRNVVGLGKGFVLVHVAARQDDRALGADASRHQISVGGVEIQQHDRTGDGLAVEILGFALAAIEHGAFGPPIGQRLQLNQERMKRMQAGFERGAAVQHFKTCSQIDRRGDRKFLHMHVFRPKDVVEFPLDIVRRGGVACISRKTAFLAGEKIEHLAHLEVRLFGQRQRCQVLRDAFQLQIRLASAQLASIGIVEQLPGIDESRAGTHAVHFRQRLLDGARDPVHILGQGE
ncbi:MAG: hypothetical protein BWZ10_01268 [candidate division BRC1 bacterium ADurb.BinA364]|nr:MAG: hypothetical protein BWZ10_01268 [candidate division BRC1 bacterium ADurb.BinA364]